MGVTRVDQWPGISVRRENKEVYEAMMGLSPGEVIVVDGFRFRKKARSSQSTFYGYGRTITNNRGGNEKPSQFQTSTQELRNGEGFGVYVRRKPA